MASTETQATGTAVARVNVVKQQLAAMRPSFLEALPSHIKPEKFIRVVQTVVSQNPKLLDCDRTSLFAKATELAQLGLMPDGILGEAALVPGYGRGGMVVQARVMYKGLLKLVRNSEEINTIFADIVYSNDKYKFNRATRDFEHEEPEDGSIHRGHPIRYYARAKWRDTGDWETLVMTKADVERVRDTTDGWKAFKAGKIKDTPWETHFDAMALKTVLRALCKTLPQSTSLRKAMALEQAADMGRTARLEDDTVIVDGQFSEVEAPQEIVVPQGKPGTGRLNALAGALKTAHDDDGVVIEAEAVPVDLVVAKAGEKVLEGFAAD